MQITLKFFSRTTAPHRKHSNNVSIILIKTHEIFRFNLKKYQIEHEDNKGTSAVSPNLSTYRTEPYLNQTLKPNFSKTPRQKLKVNIYSCRVGLSLSEYNFTFFVSEIGLQSLIKVRLGTVRRQVRVNSCNL